MQVNRLPRHWLNIKSFQHLLQSSPAHGWPAQITWCPWHQGHSTNLPYPSSCAGQLHNSSCKGAWVLPADPPHSQDELQDHRMLPTNNWALSMREWQECRESMLRETEKKKGNCRSINSTKKSRWKFHSKADQRFQGGIKREKNLHQTKLAAIKYLSYNKKRYEAHSPVRPVTGAYFGKEGRKQGRNILTKV